MKRSAIVILFALFAASAYSQAMVIQPKPKPKQELRLPRILAGGLLFFTGGAADGMTELLRNNYPRFQNRWPNADASYWNPALSWKRKHKNGDPAQGPAFLGSRSIFVFATDAYHAFRTIDRWTTLGAGVIHFFDAPRPWYTVLGELVFAWMARTAGFHLTYTLMHP